MRFLCDGRTDSQKGIERTEQTLAAMETCIKEINQRRGMGKWKGKSIQGSTSQLITLLRHLSEDLKIFGSEDIVPFKIRRLLLMLMRELRGDLISGPNPEVISQLRWLMVELSGPKSVERLILEINPGAVTLSKKEGPTLSPEDQLAYRAYQVAQFRKEIRSMEKARRLRVTRTATIKVVIRVHSLLKDVSYSL